jgi:sulfur carrier protein ThiS
MNEVNQDTAKDFASRVVGRWGLAAIVFIIGMVIFSAFALAAEALTPIVGLASSVIMALISMLVGITGTKDKEERPEFKVIMELISRLDQKEPPMAVKVDGDKVIVSKGHDTITMKKED